MPSGAPTTPIALGRYTLHGEIASGGMATVYLAHVEGEAGFSRVVAIKRMLPRLARDPAFVAMFLDEARIASRVHHPNVVPILDVVAEGDGFFIVMDHVRGLSLAALLQAAAERSAVVPVEVAAGILSGVLAGLHAAHEARGKDGELLAIVHRDVSPHNVLIGADGVPRVTDFGIAKASHKLHVTQAGQLKGKLSYMAPEQFRGEAIDRRADLFAAGVVLWGMLAGRRLFFSRDVTETMHEVLNAPIPRLAELRADVPPELDAVLARALERDRSLRFATARDFARALEEACPRLGGPSAIGEWVEGLAGGALAERDRRSVLAEMSTDPSARRAPAPEDDAPETRDEQAAGGRGAVGDDPPSEVQTLELRPPHPEPPPPAPTGPPPSATETETQTASPTGCETATTHLEPSSRSPPTLRRRAKGVAAAGLLLLATAGVVAVSSGVSGPRAGAPPGADSRAGARALPEQAAPPSMASMASTALAALPAAPAGAPDGTALAADGGLEVPRAPPGRAPPRARPLGRSPPAGTPAHNGPVVDTPLLPERP